MTDGAINDLKAYKLTQINLRWYIETVPFLADQSENINANKTRIIQTPITFLLYTLTYQSYGQF